jgi:hypothetical protein
LDYFADADRAGAAHLSFALVEGGNVSEQGHWDLNGHCISGTRENISKIFLDRA